MEIPGLVQTRHLFKICIKNCVKDYCITLDSSTKVKKKINE